MTHRIAGPSLDFSALRSELGVPGEFPPAVLDEAARAATAVASEARPLALDATDLPLVTIDPLGSRDLDQAVWLGQRRDGWDVAYAIADVASFVAPGGALDAEARSRGETLYFPDCRVPLHPPVLSEGAASLLPGQVRPAVLWRFRLEEDGSPATVDVHRALVRSTAQLDYAAVQAGADAGALPEPIAALPQVGRALLGAARRRHAVDIDLPEQEVVPVAGGGWTLEARAGLEVERWNAQLSLLTGMAAARLMLSAGVGILRTVPPPGADTVEALRGAALALGLSWPPGATAGDVLARLDRSDPRAVALVDHAAALLRGSAYTPFDGAPPPQPLHSGIAAPYAHVTAPLRRLVDRFGSEVCLAAAAGVEVPGWCRSALAELPALMQRADRLAHEADRAVVDATEAWLLRDRVGEVFEAVVIGASATSGTVVLEDPAVRARCEGAGLPVGRRISVRLAEADVAARLVRFTALEGAGSS